MPKHEQGRRFEKTIWARIPDTVENSALAFTTEPRKSEWENVKRADSRHEPDGI